MMLARLAFISAAPFLLVSCLLTPGKFVSSLEIRADRSFTFAYAGEAIALENAMDAEEKCKNGEGGRCEAEAADAKRKRDAGEAAKLREIAAALQREVGYRSLEYLGGRRFRVDYQISGTLDRGFVFPFNSDAAAIIPWLAVELRKDGTARVKAPGFGEEDKLTGAGPVGPLNKASDERDGTFTLTTDADIVMQNEEGGVQPGTGGGKKIVWRVTPGSKTVPTAVIRFRQ